MSPDFGKSRAKVTSDLTPIVAGRHWSLRNMMLPGAVLLVIAFGWYIVLHQTEILTQTTIAVYQQMELAIVQAVGRSVEQYVSEQVKEHGRTNVAEFEQEIFERFIDPIHLLKSGDAWIYAPDHVVYDHSEDFPQAYRGKSMAQIFAIQAEHGASHYQEMTEAVINAREGIGWYIWLPNTGQEIAAWTPATIGNLVWIIGLSTPLPEIMESTGAASQIRASIVTMALASGVALALLTAWGISTSRRKQAEAALAEEHGLLRTFIDNIPDVIYVKDTGSRFLVANKEVANLMGTTPDKLIGRTDFDFYTEELAREYYADEAAILSSGQALVNKDELNIDHTGYKRWLSTTKVPFRDSQGRIKGLVGIGRDTTERKQMEQALQKAHAELETHVQQRTAELTRANERLAALYKVGQTITAPLRLEVVLDVIARSTAQLLATDTGVILLLDEVEQVLTIRGAHGLSEQVVKGTRDRVGESIAGRVVQTGQPIIANDLPNDLRFYNPAVAKEEFLACASVPLVVGEKIIGTLDVHSKVNRHAFTAEHIQILKMLASQAAIAIENARLYEEVQRARDDLEERVRQRTAELVAANEQLQEEVTERKRAEMAKEALIAELEAKNEALRKSELRYRLLAENATDIIWTSDLNFKLTYVSPSIKYSLGYDVEEVMAQPIATFLTSSSQWEISQALHEELAQGLMSQNGLPKTRTLELESICKNGSTLWAEVKMTFINSPEGQPSGILGVTRDISERKRLEEQLRQAQKMEAVGLLAGGIAHDFNNLLTAILGYSNLLLADLSEDSPLRSDIVGIKKAGERAATLTRQLLAFSRQQVLKPELLNLNSVVANMGEMLYRLIGEDIELVTLHETELAWIKADPNQIEQVIVNLVVNARDAMPQGGKLIIETAHIELDEAYARSHMGVKPGHYVLLTISDTGQGMDTETQTRIFDPFFTTKEQGKGTGLGLATVHGIVSQSGGHIWVYSEPGQGTTFRIYLPQAQGNDITIKSAENITRPPHGSETVLLVEDNREVRNLIRRILLEHGYTVLEASDGVEALQLAQTCSDLIHLLITDVVMPGGLSGLQLAQQLTSYRPELKVLYVSGYNDAIVHHGVFTSGPTAFLQKPFTPHILARKVREVLDTGSL